MQEEAKKRDHRKIGHEMGLFAMDAEYVGPGLPLWLPKGTAIIEALEDSGQGNGISGRLRPRAHPAYRQGDHV